MENGQPSVRGGESRRWPGHALLAATLYLGLALWAVRAILPAPASTFALPRDVIAKLPHWEGIIQSDQKLTAALITHNARTLVRAPWRLFESAQCYPAPRAVTLGEHMFGVGLLGVVPWLLSGDPIVTYNIVAPLTCVIAALSMYALVYAWTGSPAAALVAGLLFGFHPSRVGDLVHPYVRGNQWTPLALLFAHRLFVHGRWRDAAGLVLFVGLQTLESLYAVLAMAILGGTYAVYLGLRYWRRLPLLAPKLLASVAGIAAIAAAVLGPYLETRAIWGTLSGRATFLHDPASFGPGGAAYPGSVMLLLALVGILDRLRRARGCNGGYDPRLAYLVAGLLVAWASVYDFVLPGLGFRVPSLFYLGGRVVPGLDALRAGGALSSGVYLVGAFLAAYGVLALVEGRGRLGRRVFATVVVTAAIAEVFHPAAARSSFGTSLEMKAYLVRPMPRELELYAKLLDAPVLDLPLEFQTGGFFRMSDYVFAGAYHGRPVAGCYNSFTLPIQTELEALAARGLRDPAAAQALYGLGFRNVLVHLLVPGRRRAPPLIPSPLPPHLAELGRSGTTVLLELRSPLAVRDELAALAAAAVPAPPEAAPPRTVPGEVASPAVARLEAVPPDVASPAVASLEVAPRSGASPEVTLPIRFRNAGSAIYRHPDPILPTALLARWRDPAGAVVGEEHVRALLPLALAPGAETVREMRMPAPRLPGTYQLTLAPEATPDLVLARLEVNVRAAPARGRP